MKNKITNWLLAAAILGLSGAVFMEANGWVDWIDQDAQIEITKTDTITVTEMVTEFKEVPVVKWRDWVDTFYKHDSVFFVDTITQVITEKIEAAKDPHFYVDEVEFKKGKLDYAILTDGTLEGFFPEMTFYPQEVQTIVKRPKWGYRLGGGMMRTVNDYRWFFNGGVRYGRYEVGVMSDAKIENVGVSIGVSW